LNKLYKESFDFMYSDAHGVSYILDPRYIGDGMCQQVSNKIEDFYLHFRLRMGVQQVKRKRLQCHKSIHNGKSRP
jgi:hypothetical protein